MERIEEVTNSNSLDDISNTKKIESVILQGKLFDRALLNEMLGAVKAANDVSRTKEITNF